MGLWKESQWQWLKRTEADNVYNSWSLQTCIYSSSSCLSATGVVRRLGIQSLHRIQINIYTHFPEDTEWYHSSKLCQVPSYIQISLNSQKDLFKFHFLTSLKRRQRNISFLQKVKVSEECFWWENATCYTLKGRSTCSHLPTVVI